MIGRPGLKERQTLCVVVPCYNEQGVVTRFHEALSMVLDTLAGIDSRIVFVDDGSGDRTLEELNELAERDGRVRVYSLSRNFGHQIALSAGLDVAAADAVLMMDADMQHPPELIPRMVELWRDGNDVVSAVRESTANALLFKRLTSAAFYWLINRISSTPIVPGVADFCLLSRRAQRALCSMPERHRFLRGMVSWIGFSRAFVRFQAGPRAAGESKYSLWRMISLALDAACSFSSAPIRLATRIGGLVVLLGGSYLLYVLARYLIVGDLVPGWGSLICTLLIIGGTQLVFIGLIGEYLTRVYDEAKQRPLYFWKQTPPRVADRTRPALRTGAATGNQADASLEASEFEEAQR